MRVVDIAVEATRNVRGGAARSVLLVLVASLLTAALAMLDMTQVREVVRQAEQYRAAGASTYQVVTDGAVDGTRCHALASLTGVDAAGALRAGDSFVPAATPRTALPVYEITPGLAAILAGEPTVGVLLESKTADGLGVGPGTVLVGRDGEDVPVVALYDYADDGRDRRPSFALMRSGTPSGRYAECWLSLWPPDMDLASRLLRTVVTPELAREGSARVVQHNPGLGPRLDAADRFPRRTGRYALPAALLLGAGVTVAGAWLRRLELSLGRHLGLRRIEVAALLVLETALVAPLVILVGAAVSATYAWASGSIEVWPFGLRLACAVPLGMVVGALLAGLGTAERRVLRQFKER